MGRLSKDFWVGLVMLAGSAVYWMGAGSIPISPLDGEVNAAAMPKFLAVVLAGLSILLMLKALLAGSERPAAEDSSVKDSSAEVSDETKVSSGRSRLYEHLRASGLIVIGLGYMAVLPYLGYLISIGLLLIAMALYMGEKFSSRLLMISAGLAVGFQLFFVQLLHIQLPSGILGQLKFF